MRGKTIYKLNNKCSQHLNPIHTNLSRNQIGHTLVYSLSRTSGGRKVLHVMKPQLESLWWYVVFHVSYKCIITPYISSSQKSHSSSSQENYGTYYWEQCLTQNPVPPETFTSCTDSIRRTKPNQMCCAVHIADELTAAVLIGNFLRRVVTAVITT